MELKTQFQQTTFNTNIIKTHYGSKTSIKNEFKVQKPEDYKPEFKDSILTKKTN